MSSVNMTLQSNTSCELALNKFNLPIEAFTKSYLKDLKPALKLRRERIRVKKAALKKAKKAQKRKNVAKERAFKKTNDWIQANKNGKNVVRREILGILKTMDIVKIYSYVNKEWYDSTRSEGYTINDLIAELERQLQ